MKPLPEKTLVSHLEELRGTLLRSIVFLGICFIPLYFAAPFVLDQFFLNLDLGGRNLHFFSPMEMFLLQLKVAFLLDSVVSSPFVAYNLWKFVIPGLYESERRFVRRMSFCTSVLFIGGVSFCLLVCFPMVVKFGLGFESDFVKPLLRASSIVDLSLCLSFAFGIMFQFPLLTFGLVKCGIVSYESVCRARPYVLVVVLLLAAIFTPPDVVSQLVLGIPTYLLFECGLLFARRYRSRDR